MGIQKDGTWVFSLKDLNENEGLRKMIAPNAKVRNKLLDLLTGTTKEDRDKFHSLSEPEQQAYNNTMYPK